MWAILSLFLCEGTHEGGRSEKESPIWAALPVDQEKGPTDSAKKGKTVRHFCASSKYACPSPSLRQSRIARGFCVERIGTMF